MTEAVGPQFIPDGVKLGDTVFVEKTIGETDVYLFAGITGDLAPNHVNERYMQGSVYGRRIAHGALLVGFTSAAATLFGSRSGGAGVSAGYDRLRFIAPVFLGDTIRVQYRIVRIDHERQRTHAELLVSNQHGQLVMAGEHILKFLPHDELNNAAAGEGTP